jgi:hypothetical protein
MSVVSGGRCSLSQQENDMQHTHLPSAIQAFVDTTNAGDSEAFVATFTADATLYDWGRRFVGRDGVREWNTSDNIGVQAHFDVLGIEPGESAEAYVLTVRVTGNGYNGTSPLAFRLRDGLVANLRIG